MGTWQSLVNIPAIGVSTMLLAADGSVVCRADDSAAAGGNGWLRLSPDTSGEYLSGSWSSMPPMKNARRYFASAVLKDGRIFVAGGEYSDAGSDINAAEIFDPIANA